jgi:hypothetical protein
MVQFGTPSGKGSPKATAPARNDSLTDGTGDLNNVSGSSNSSVSSASSSPHSPVMPLSVDGASDSQSMFQTQSHFPSRSASPGPVTGSGPDDLNKSSFQYGYSMHGGIFPERSHTPTACV